MLNVHHSKINFFFFFFFLFFKILFFFFFFFFFFFLFCASSVRVSQSAGHQSFPILQETMKKKHCPPPPHQLHSRIKFSFFYPPSISRGLVASPWFRGSRNYSAWCLMCAVLCFGIKACPMARVVGGGSCFLPVFLCLCPVCTGMSGAVSEWRCCPTVCMQIPCMEIHMFRESCPCFGFRAGDWYSLCGSSTYVHWTSFLHIALVNQPHPLLPIH